MGTFFKFVSLVSCLVALCVTLIYWENVILLVLSASFTPNPSENPLLATYSNRWNSYATWSMTGTALVIMRSIASKPHVILHWTVCCWNKEVSSLLAVTSGPGFLRPPPTHQIVSIIYNTSTHRLVLPNPKPDSRSIAFCLRADPGVRKWGGGALLLNCTAWFLLLFLFCSFFLLFSFLHNSSFSDKAL